MKNRLIDVLNIALFCCVMVMVYYVTLSWTDDSYTYHLMYAGY